MPMFSIKDLLIATLLISLGAGMLWTAFNPPGYMGNEAHTATIVLLYFAGGIIAGAGVLKPFRRAGLGAALGFVVQLVILMSH
jgi:hypothetical protein